MPFVYMLLLLLSVTCTFAESEQYDPFFCQQELNLRDSIIVAKDSAFRLRESLYEKELLLKTEKESNFGSSYNLMKKEYLKCSISLQKVAEKAEESQAVSDTLSGDDDSSSKTKIAVGASFLGGFAVGAFLFSLFF